MTDLPANLDADIRAAERRLTAELRERTGFADVSVKIDRNPLRPDQFAVTVVDPHEGDLFHDKRAAVPGGIVEWDQPGPLTDEQAAEFANLIERMREAYRPGVPDDVVPEQAREVTGGEHPDKLAAGGIIAAARHREPDPEPEAEQVAVTYTAACRPCIDVAEDVGAQHLASVPFATVKDRDTWAGGHARLTGHTVTLAVQGPSGSTITGRMTPDQQVMGPPLVAFVVRHGAEPDLLCRIPERAGAAWLMSAAYAVMLGHGGTSLGVPAAHRVMYVGRTSLPAEETVKGEHGEVVNLHVRVDGVLGATGPEFGPPVGRTYYVDQRLDPATAEDVIETLITRETGLGRHLFGVILVADTAPVPPADEHADRVLREQRRAERLGQVIATGRAVPPEGALLGVPRDLDHPIEHSHGSHTPADYAEHQQPIDDERFPQAPATGGD